jgi:FkbM family methyltransferase
MAVRYTQARYGPMMYRDNDMYVGRSYELYGEYSEHEIELLRTLIPRSTMVLDVGANIGALTVPLAQHVGEGGHVIAFEPQRLVWQMLTGNVALNDLRNVTPHYAAVGADRGIVEIPISDMDNEANHGGCSLRDAHNPDVRTERVKILRLDDLHHAGLLSSVSLIKIDVEGYEFDVIQGAEQTIKEHRPIIYSEADRADVGNRCRAWLIANGYEVLIHNPPLFNENNHAGNNENVWPQIVSTNLIAIPCESKIERPVI